MRKYTIQTTLMLLLIIAATSCVDRKTKNEEGTVRLEAPADNTADADSTDTGMSNEDMVELADAKGIINDYYSAFTRKAPREAFDMWDQANTDMPFAKFSEENPNYEKITVAFEEDTQMEQVDSVYTATIPLRVSATDAEGNITNAKGVAKLKKDAKEDNAKYKIESMDLKKEDS
ncbi:MAG TPA: hypothetical protein ENH91_08630 [Leeuwenhoekiella sp.]|nr:hypothetical protein [Leeuwenhoekiella sp.]